MDYIKEYEKWLASDSFDDATKEELKSIQGNEKEIEDRFHKKLDFGTAGLRGIMGAGTNRINKYTILSATQGLANYINKQDVQNKSVAIAYDCRINSDEYAKETASCLAANGIKAYIFDSLRPTPELSYALRKLGCIAGVNVTASHNPREYNGYKVYWEDGAQITPPHDKGIIDEVNKIQDFDECKNISYEEGIKNGLIEEIGKEIDDAYINEIKTQIQDFDLLQQYASKLKVVYTPLNGAGNLFVRRILDEIGITNVYIVKEQENPDGNFPTTPYPNPELNDVFKLALELASEVDADIILATDPDSDRLGAYVKDKDGSYHLLTGNMIGSLIMNYELLNKQEKGLLTDKSYVVKTIVSTNLIDSIANYYNVNLIKVLTGFKYIGEQIKLRLEDNETYEFGFEESYGYLIGTHARDKDAVVSAMAFCEMACYYKSRNMSVYEGLVELYDKFGYIIDGSFSITLAGTEGEKKILQIMETFRNEKISSISNHDVLQFIDYKTGIVTDNIKQETSKTTLPSSNVLYYSLENNSFVCIRPSGTEPKIKIYVGTSAKTKEEATKIRDNIEKEFKTRIDKI